MKIRDIISKFRTNFMGANVLTFMTHNYQLPTFYFSTDENGELEKDYDGFTCVKYDHDNRGVNPGQFETYVKSCIGNNKQVRLVQFRAEDKTALENMGNTDVVNLAETENFVKEDVVDVDKLKFHDHEEGLFISYDKHQSDQRS